MLIISKQILSLNLLKTGESAVVASVGGDGGIRRHFLDIGFIPGAVVTLVGRAPLGDPLEVKVQGGVLTLRKEEAEGIMVSYATAGEQDESEAESDFSYNLSLHEHNSHPGYGEEGKYHDHSSERKLPKDTRLTIALVGQPNSGKTTLFNALTGENRHVGNFPGVTMDRIDAAVNDHPEAVVTDLPGIFSLSAESEDERVARRFLVGEKPKVIINIVDINNIERHLYLTVQLLELGIPMVLALNMMDEMKESGGVVRVNELERELGIPVVPIAAAEGDGINELLDHALHVARYQEVPAKQDFCRPDEHDGAIHRCLHSLMHLVEDHALRAGISSRFAADRLADGDDDIADLLQLSRNEREMVEHIVLQMEEERGLDRHAAMAEMRYSFINRLCRHTIRRPSGNRKEMRTREIDSILTGQWTAIPSFFAIIATVFWLTFDVIGARLQALILSGMDSLSHLTEAAFLKWNVSGPVTSLVVDAIFGGVGMVVSFVPIIVVLFFFLSLLEDSGYMSRIAFVSDKLLRKIGLSGRSIIPLLISFGCSVPGVMSTGTLPSSRDRKFTILLIPFMSCSTKTAIYGFFTAAFFPGKAGLVMTLLYLLGIAVGIICAMVMKLFRRHHKTAPFVMEMPVYRLPKLKNLLHLLWDKVRDFLQMAFTVIFISTIVVWLLQSFDFKLNFIPDGEGSILSVIAGFIAPLFEPIGLGDWRIVTALISGFLAKESVVSTLEVLGGASLFTAASAVSMLVFCLLYTPCIAAVSAIRRELGGRWALFVVVFQCLVAWVCAFAAYLIAL